MKHYLNLPCCVTLACLVSWSSADYAQAQRPTNYGESLLQSFKNQNYSGRYSIKNLQRQVAARSVAAVGVQGVNRQTYTNLFSNSSRPPQASKPFSNLQRGPSVTPYLRLNGSLDGVADYYSQVRPAREQQQATLREQRQLNLRRQQLNQAAASGAYVLTGDPNTPSTGHTTTYMYLGNFQQTGTFFPGIQGLEKQRIDQ
jgi:hypothetical protein